MTLNVNNKVTGINKIKGVNTGQNSNDDSSNIIYPSKSKVVQNLQTKVSIGGGKNEVRNPPAA
jgi:hypothetical protein